jgi:methylglutaconyl-CoA hydratase
MSYQTLTISEANRVALITLNRPEKRNAISMALIHELMAAFAELERSDARVVIITGAGKSFCAGMDLDELKSLTGRSREDSQRDSETMARLFRGVYDFPKPLIAAVNGPAIAGGCGIATLCDFTLASTEAKFGYTEVRIGFLPAIVSTFLLRQIGEKHARDLLMTGRIITAEEAARIGLINEVLAPESLISRAYELAAQLIENSPTSLTATKRLLNSFAVDDLNADIQAAVDANADIRSTADFREGVTSFLEKRKPQWKENS